MRALRPFGAAVLILLCVAAPARLARAGETVEPFEDGSPKRRYATDEAGLKEGPYVEYYRGGRPAVQATYRHDLLEGAYLETYENGHPRLRTSYRAGKRHGKLETFAPDDAPTELSTWVDGTLDGKRQVWRAKKLLVTQTWRLGTILTFDGVPAFPRPKEEVTRTVAAILAGELPAAEPRAGKSKPERKPKAAPAAPTFPASIPGLAAASPALAKDREGALRRLRAYRYVCDIPWADVVAGETETIYAQGAAIVCAKLGDISHTPPNPGLPDDVYAVGAKGAAKSNLAYGQDQGATRAVDGWMDDSDKRNIGAVGHRRWALSLEVRVVGFGTERAGESDYSVLYVEDTSRVPPRDLPFVVFPARGWMPSDMFSGHHAWSVAVDPIAALRIDTTHLTARVTRLSPDFVPVEETLPIEMSVYETTALAGRHAFIFRPKGLEVADGAAYLAEVLAPDPKSHKPTVLVRWITGFVGEPLPERGSWGGPPEADSDK